MWRCQDLVIGSGPGGSVTAGLLAEAGRDVVVAEEGPDEDATPPAPFSLAEMALRYRYRGLNPAFGKPKIAFVEGCCAGGGSEINSGLYHRTPAEVLEAWHADYGLAEAGPDDMLPHFAAVERSLGVTLSPGPLPLAARKLGDGAAALGWKWMEVPRWVEYDGGWHPDGSAASTRRTMLRTWIPRARQAGARLVCSARVRRLEPRGGGWLAATAGGSIRADHVFLCGGAVQTPLLLRRTGIRRHVGDSLAMHPPIKVVARFRDEVNYPGLGVPFVQVKQFAPRLTFGSSVATPPYLALAMLDHPEARERVLREWRSAAIYYVALTGAPHGTVRGLPFTEDPLVRYQLTAADLRDLAGGLRDLCRLLWEAGAVELFPSLAGGGSLQAPGDEKRLPAAIPAGRASLMSIHLFGSCPMGQRRERTAADSFGRVWDVPGISVHDASLLCGAPSVNPQGSVMAFAARNTLRYLDTLRSAR